MSLLRVLTMGSKTMPVLRCIMFLHGLFGFRSWVWACEFYKKVLLVLRDYGFRESLVSVEHQKQQLKLFTLDAEAPHGLGFRVLAPNCKTRDSRLVSNLQSDCSVESSRFSGTGNIRAQITSQTILGVSLFVIIVQYNKAQTLF